jgi:hypothetical protein
MKEKRKQGGADGFQRRPASEAPRAEAVERARRLLADPNWPNLAGARQLSDRILDSLLAGD